MPNWLGGSSADVPNLNDPDNPKSELTPRDYEAKDGRSQDQIGADQRLSAFVQDCFTRARRARQPLERDWTLNIAMMEGRQWLGWDDATHRAISLMDDNEQDRYITDPLIEPLLTKWVALVTTTKPDASVVPMNDTDASRLAAREGNAILGHLDRRCNLAGQSIEAAYWLGVCGVAWVKERWAPEAFADVPVDGACKSLAVGEVEEEVLSPFEVFLDPSARRWRDVRWIIHATMRPLSWFQEHYGSEEYGGAGWRVQPGKMGGMGTAASGGFISPFMAGFGGASALRTGPLSTPSGAANNEALCLEMWEEPSAKYPEGRYIVLGGDVVCYSGDWPYKRGKRSSASPDNKFPFIRGVYREAFGHAYGMSLVSKLSPLQVAYNRLISRAFERFDQDKLTVGIEKGSGLAPDDFDPGAVGIEEGRNIRKIFFNRGSREPSWMAPPPLSELVDRLRQSVWMDMQHIAGIHDVDMGQAPPGVTAGVAIEMLQQGDRTQMALPLQQLEAMAQWRAEWRLALYAQFAATGLPRMIGLDASGNPDQAAATVQSFKGMMGGGMCAPYVAPGSATPKSPAGEFQQVMDLFGQGLLGDPADPKTKALAIRLLSLSKSNDILEHLMDVERRAAAAGPDPNQQAKMEAAAAMQAHQHDQEMQAAQMKLQAAAQSEQVKSQSVAQVAAARTQAQAALEAQRHAQDMQTADLKHEQDVQKLLVQQQMNGGDSNIGNIQ